MKRTELNLGYIQSLPEITKIQSDCKQDADSILRNEKLRGYFCIHFEEFGEMWFFNSQSKKLRVYELDEVKEELEWVFADEFNLT